MAKKVGFIGLGIMGKPMALNLRKKGHELTVNDLNQEAVQILVESGAAAASSPREVAENCEIIITMLPASQHCKLLFWGNRAFYPEPKKAQLLSI